MPKRLPNGYRLSRTGKTIIAINVTPEFRERIMHFSRQKSLTQQAYIISAINDALEEDEQVEREKTNWGRSL